MEETFRTIKDMLNAGFPLLHLKAITLSIHGIALIF